MGLSVNNIIDDTDFNNLVTAVKNECNRRHYTNPLTAPNIGTKSAGSSITYSDINALLASLCRLKAFPGSLDTSTYINSYSNTSQPVTLKNFQYNIIKALNAVSTTVSTASQTTNIKFNEDCRGNCAGLCTGCTSCDGCTGTCTGSCTGSCKGSCKDTCKDTCKGSCEGSCDGNCWNSCYQGCDGGCSGCRGCTAGIASGVEYITGR